MPRNRRIVYGRKLKRSALHNGSVSSYEVTKPEDLDRLNKAELIAFLQNDYKDKLGLWNDWRVLTDRASLDLTEAVLTGANLEGIELNFVHLSGAKLSLANLEGADLYGIYLDGARLWRAHLQRAYLVEAHLEGANLTEAHFEEAILKDANLEGAVLVHTRFDEANLGQANLGGANLIGAHLERAILIGACLEGSAPLGAYFDGALLDDASLAYADLRKAHLQNVALSPLIPGGLRGVKLYQTYFWGVLSLRYEQFLEDESNPNSPSAIWEHTQGRFSEAKDIYKTLKGYFEDAGDYEGANWAYRNEQEMEKLMYAPERAHSWLYHQYNWEPYRESGEENKTFLEPGILEWLRLEISDKLAGYGLSLTKPLFWLAVVIFGFAALYAIFGMITTMPGCSYVEQRIAAQAGCAPSHNYFDALMFSFGAMTTIDTGTVQPYLSHVGLVASLEALLGIALTGLFGFVLGNKLRNS